MRYAYLLSLIDADLERLRTARKLLLTSQTLKQRLDEQRSPRRGRDKAQVLALVDQEMRVSTLATEPSNETSSSVAVKASSELEETISPQRVWEQTPSSGEQSAPYEKADPLSPQRKLTLRPLPARQRSTPPQTALNTPAPARPVFVTAEQIRREHLGKQTVLDSEGAGFNSAPVPLTAELLTQRWISELR